ncbi:tRNA-guanine transglycosylase, partial [Staphylococcus capitis]|uniref:tRNA-guanine transglycosylase n=1 Tax=Staphylococcus capitis TaxID=29388 RepID=UPI003709B07B
MLTHSAAFQLFSFSNFPKITQHPLQFTHHTNPSKLFLTPQNSIQIQSHLPSDIIMPFDQSPPIPSQYHYLKNSIQKTTPSPQTSLKPHQPPQPQPFF